MINKEKNFIRFLKEKGLYRKFTKNFNDRKKGHLWRLHYKKLNCRNLNDFLSSIPAPVYLINCFCWDSTNEGYFYWCEISRNWESFVDEYHRKMLEKSFQRYFDKKTEIVSFSYADILYE